MTHLIFAPTGTLKRRSKRYVEQHAEILSPRTHRPDTSKDQRKRDRRAAFKQTGDLNG